MACNEQELLPIDQIKSELHSLCTESRSGDFCLFTEEKHAAVISIHEGKIIGLRYRISRGNDALKLIKCIGKAKIRFQKSRSSTNQAATTDIPSTTEILKSLGIELDGSAVQKTDKKVLVVEDSRTQRAVICRMDTTVSKQVMVMRL